MKKTFVDVMLELPVDATLRDFLLLFFFIEHNRLCCL